MSAVENALDELRQCLVEFVTLLEQETRALMKTQTEELSAIVAEKTRWSTSANTAWNRLVIVSGIDTRKGESLDATLSASPTLHTKWREVRQLAEKAERLNHSNNILIEGQLERTRQALDVLQSAANRGTLYGANGRIVDGFQSGHTLDKA